MTYSGKIKEEISKVESEKIESISELSGILCTNADIKLYSIRVQTENLNAANRIFKIVKDNYNCIPNVLYGGSINEINITTLKKIKYLDGYLIGKSSTDVNKLEKILLNCK